MREGSISVKSYWRRNISGAAQSRAFLDEPNAAFVNSAGTTVKLVFTTRVGSNGITTIMLYSKMPFNEAFDALMTLRASIGRF